MYARTGEATSSDGSPRVGPDSLLRFGCRRGYRLQQQAPRLGGQVGSAVLRCRRSRIRKRLETYDRTIGFRRRGDRENPRVLFALRNNVELK